MNVNRGIWQMIVVLTDGQFAQSNAFNDSALQVAVSSLNQKGVVVFFFSLGSGDADNPPDPLTALRTLSCQMNSTVSYVSLSNAMTNALWTIRPYFDYQATLRYKQNTTYWTDTYPDYDGLGNVSTVTYPGMQDFGPDSLLTISQQRFGQRLHKGFLKLKSTCGCSSVNLHLKGWDIANLTSCCPKTCGIVQGYSVETDICLGIRV